MVTTRAVLGNTVKLRVQSGAITSLAPLLARGEQGLPGPGSAAWTALDATVTTGSIRQAPDGSWIKSTATRTTRASFDATEQTFWTAVLGTAGTIEAAALAARDAHNILDFGVVRGTASSQTTAILAAFAANPGDGFYFPPGDYRCDTSLAVTTDNSIVLAPGARIYAGAAMGTLIDYDNGEAAAADYSQDKCLVGQGELDANLLANKALTLSSVLRFGLGDGLTITDPVNRGIHLKSAGAEVIARNIRIHNTGTTNSARTASVTTTSASATVTSTAAFLSTDVGSPITGTGIPVGATITAFASTSSVTISANATASATVTASILSNIGIEADMGDCQFSDIVTRDFSMGVWDKGGNVWNDVHPWIGSTAQLTVRYPTSVAFIMAGNSKFGSPYADTYRVAFRTAAATGYSQVQIVAPKVYTNGTNLTNGLASASPGTIFDLLDGSKVVATSGKYLGHTVTPHVFTAGTTTRLTARNNIDLSAGSVTSLAEYHRGVQLGNSSFSPTVFASVSGSLASGSVAGTMHVSDAGVATYVLRVTTGVMAASGVSGNLRIGNIPYPTGASALNIGGIHFAVSTGIDATGGVAGGVTSGPWVIVASKSSAGTTAQVPLVNSQSVEFTATVVCPLTFPS